ncbi:TetR/AcrR family transcriptional regulator [Agreia sp. VKM Ac-1783]|uniref:TetR/AcrR family transcriptional regulator n=1 Tax=Agreia sp. VKM Ac-1783 TaxID=1938889 RepID=UPI000A2AE98E|nr:TetR/AcrR family transcriptional regulator [Agreia sp. VKM Ac-1783]SMQ74919.1 transcriptional regulator, TetR family [Agreia sp. VKM Ac-1783]
MSKERILSTADARRADVLAAATQAFGRTGYWGTNTTEIARDAGISQAYLYRLFANKEELFVAVIGEIHNLFRDEIDRILAETPREDALQALLSPSSTERTGSSDAGKVLLHASAASNVEPIGVAVRQCYSDQADYLSSRGLNDEEIRSYFAWSQYANALRSAGIGADVEGGALQRLLPH